MNSHRQLKLSLSGLVSSYNIDYILNGLRNNSEVYELNVSNCGLVQQDMQKIVEVMRDDKYVVCLKIQKNNFTSIEPIIELFNQ